MGKSEMVAAYVAKVMLPGEKAVAWFYFKTAALRKAFVAAHKDVAKARRGKPFMVFAGEFERTQMNISYYFG